MKNKLDLTIVGLVFFAAALGCKPSETTTAPTSSTVETPVNAEKSKNLQIEFSDNFNMTTWYKYFKNVAVKGKTIEVKTFLDTNGKDASGICSGISSLIYMSDSNHDETIIVYSNNDEVLIRRNGMSEQCK